MNSGNKTSVIAAFVSIAIFAPALWMLLDRAPPYIVTGGKIEPENPAPGSQISVLWEVKSVRSCPASPRQSVTRTIVDSKNVRHDYAPVEALYGKGTQGHPEIKRTVELPASIPPGPARYSSIACYACNPLQQLWPVCITMPEILFEVMESPT
jgi:hypothetical protein